MIFQIHISLITRWDNSSESYWETVLHGKIMEIEPNLSLTSPGGLWLQVLERTADDTKAEMIQCAQTNIKSTTLLPSWGNSVFLLKTECLRDNINSLRHLQALKSVEPCARWRDPAAGLLCLIHTEPGEVSKLSVFTEIRLLLAISSWPISLSLVSCPLFSFMYGPPIYVWDSYGFQIFDMAFLGRERGCRLLILFLSFSCQVVSDSLQPQGL